MTSERVFNGRLDKLSFGDPSYGFWDAKTATFDIRTPHALHRALGYIKFARNKAGPVFFRGQKGL